jgi:hypothetical protein
VGGLRFTTIFVPAAQIPGKAGKRIFGKLFFAPKITGARKVRLV